MNKSLIALAFATIATCGTAFAAEDRDVATVVMRDGSVTASVGGDFNSVAQGQELHEGDRLMLVDGATATLRYDNDCRIHFDNSGVHTVPDRDGCLALLPQSGGTDWAGVGKIAGGVAITAALLNAMDTVPPPPVSR